MGFREGDVVVNWRSAVVFTWSEETRLKYGPQIFSLRIANEEEERRYRAICKATGRTEISTKEIGLKLRGPGTRYRNFSQALVITDPTLYLLLKHFQKDIAADNMEELIRDLLDKKRRVVQINSGMDPNTVSMINSLISVFAEASEKLRKITLQNKS